MCNSLVNANVPVDEGVVIVTVSLLLKLEIVLFVNSLVVAEKYVSKSVTATWTIVPSSFKTTLSSSTTVVEVAVVSPSNTFNSVAVDVTNVLPNIRPFVPSCDAIVKSFSPSWIFTFPLTISSDNVPTFVIWLDWSASTLRTWFNKVKPLPATSDFKRNPVLSSIAVVGANSIFEPSNVPVILVAPKSTANSVDSITKPPFAFRSTLNVFAVLDKPSPAVIWPAPENCVNVNESPTVSPEVTVNPLSAFVVPSSTNVKAFLTSAPSAKSSARVGLPLAFTT